MNSMIIIDHHFYSRSAAYFSSLANGEPLPVKRRLEPVVGTGLTVGNLDVLVQQHKGLTDKNVTKESIQNKWGRILDLYWSDAY